MFTYRLAYRHQNGEVEGFSASAFSERMAIFHATQKASLKCAALSEPFDDRLAIRNKKDVTADEMATLRADWEISDRSSTI